MDGMSVSPPPRLMCWALTIPQCDGNWRQNLGEMIRFRQDQESGALLVRLVPSQEEEERESSPRTGQAKAMRALQDKAAVHKPRSGPSPGTECAGTLTLGFPAVKTV